MFIFAHELPKGDLLNSKWVHCWEVIAPTIVKEVCFSGNIREILTDTLKRKIAKCFIFSNLATYLYGCICVDTWIRTKDPHHVKVIL